MRTCETDLQIRQVKLTGESAHNEDEGCRGYDYYSMSCDRLIKNKIAINKRRQSGDVHVTRHSPT